MDWLFREGAEFICETCRSFTVPAKGLLLMLRKIGERIESEESGYFWSNIIAPQLKTYHVFTEDEWVRYWEGTLRRVPFLYDEQGELEWDNGVGPSVMAYDEVAFQFRNSCACEDVYKRMYENISSGRGAGDSAGGVAAEEEQQGPDL